VRPLVFHKDLEKPKKRISALGRGSTEEKKNPTVERKGGQLVLEREKAKPGRREIKKRGD